MKAKRFTNKVLMIAVFMIALAMVLVPASAKLQVAISVYDTANPAIGYSIVVKDNDVNDQDLTVGVIRLVNNFQPIQNFIVQGSYHTSKLGGMDLITSGSSTVTNNRASTARAYVAVGDTDYAAPANVAKATGSGTFTNAVGSKIHLGFYNDPQNAQGANVAFVDLTDFNANKWKLTPGNLIASYDYSATIPADSFSFNSGDIAVNDPNPFSMTLLFDFDLVGKGGMLISRGQSMYKTFKDVPEFPTLALPTAMLIGLVGAVLFIRKTKES